MSVLVNSKDTCSASGSAFVLFVLLLPLGGIMLCIGRGVRGTKKLLFYYITSHYIMPI